MTGDRVGLRFDPHRSVLVLLSCNCRLERPSVLARLLCGVPGCVVPVSGSIRCLSRPGRCGRGTCMQARRAAAAAPLRIPDEAILPPPTPTWRYRHGTGQRSSLCERLGDPAVRPKVVIVTTARDVCCTANLIGSEDMMQCARHKCPCSSCLFPRLHRPDMPTYSTPV